MKKIISAFLLFVLNLSCYASTKDVLNNSEPIDTNIPNTNYQLIEDNIDFINKYQKKFKKNIRVVKPTRKTYHRLYNDNVEQTEKLAQEGKVNKIYLQDGDYVIDNKTPLYSEKYMNEYHKDGCFMGFVNIKRLKSNKKNTIIGIYEYRLNENLKLGLDGSLYGYKLRNDANFKIKHILFMELNNSDNKVSSLFVYLADGTLVCCQINGIVYLSNSYKNLIPDIESYNVASNKYRSSSSYSPIESACMTLGISLMLVGGAASIPITIGAAAVGVAAAPIWVPIWWIKKKNK